ncbi:N-acetylmuramoyl-L-alanine amidase [Desulforegula conservatrix]|uniref:N-acetylmuramoyl-L-alanine amidase n=1 Tax=Desulforegula conservatrix TaxID=153026 RepID=UPI0006887B29|nr:N-acetylmuramoyl-L-alanine amidase [Desulforegula conservatrix]
MTINHRTKSAVSNYKSLFFYLFPLLVVFLYSHGCYAGSEDNALKFYTKAESQYSNIYKSGFRESRQNWLDCAENFKKSYDAEPDGDYAPVSLYFYGKVFRDLYKFSGNQNDLETASKAFKKVSASFPKSTYSHKAETELDGIPSIKPSTPQSSTKTSESANKENQAAKNTPEPSKKADAEKTKKPEEGGISPKTDDKGNASLKVSTKESKQSEKEANSESTAVLNARIPNITGIRHWTENGYTRVVIDLDAKVSYKYGVDKKKKEGLELIVFDFKGCGIARNLKKEFSFQSKVAKSAVIKENKGSVSVLIAVTTADNFNVFPLSGPSDKLRYRIVIDLKGTPKAEISETVSVLNKSDKKNESQDKEPKNKEALKASNVEKPAEVKITKDAPQKTENLKNATVTDYDAELQKTGKGKIKPGALAKQLALGVKKIVIDPGHGGNDPGAMAQKGIREKDISLALAKSLAQSLKRRTGCEVVLTRTSDKYLHLEERTAIANTQRADLFISLHLNSSSAKEAIGIETYFLNLATDESAIAVAARENATSTKNISDLEGILKDLMRNAKIDESSRMAKYVQKNMCTHLSRKYTPIKDKGVKQAPFYVLIGAQMPAILIETGFISNLQELAKLTSPGYQADLTDSIAEGVVQYINSVSAPTYVKTPPKKKTTEKTDPKKNISPKKTEKIKKKSGDN